MSKTVPLNIGKSINSTISSYFHVISDIDEIKNGAVE